MNYRRGRTCANHPEYPFLRACPKCAEPFCSTCLPFAVNGDPWCEPCGNALLEETRPRWLAGAVVWTLGIGLVTLVAILRYVLVAGRIPYFWMLLTAGYVVAITAGWRITFGLVPGERPRIERR
jgi:hypothetical protein